MAPLRNAAFAYYIRCIIIILQYLLIFLTFNNTIFSAFLDFKRDVMTQKYRVVQAGARMGDSTGHLLTTATVQRVTMCADACRLTCRCASFDMVNVSKSQYSCRMYSTLDESFLIADVMAKFYTFVN